MNWQILRLLIFVLSAIAFDISEDCGRVYHNLQPLISEGVKEKHGESPWQAAIYRQSKNSKVLICSGTIISPYVVISAAHCFFNENELRLHNKTIFEVIVAKYYRDYETNDTKYQKSYEIEEIRIPSAFLGVGANYGYDIAIIVLKNEIQFSSIVLPACLETDESTFNVSDGAVGKLSGWGYDSSNQPSPVLLTANLTFTTYGTCLNFYSLADRLHITLDKVCGGDVTGPGARRGDSGGGYVFLHPTSDVLFPDHVKWLENNLQEIENRKLKKTLTCLLPKRENFNGKVKVICSNNIIYPSDEKVPDTCRVTIQCINHKETFQSNCSNGTWTPEIPLKCLGGCPMLSANSVRFQCFENGKPIMCEETVANGNTITPQCKELYHLKSPLSYNEIKCRNGEWDQKAPTCTADVDQICGKTNKISRIEQKKSRGRRKSEHWPWLVSFTNGTNVICIGTLIYEDWILTTRTCADYISDFGIKSAHFGDFNEYNKTDDGMSMDVPISRIIKFPVESPDDTHNNTALVRLKFPVEFSESILPLCLPTNTIQGENNNIGEWGTILEYQKGNILYEKSARILHVLNCSKEEQFSGEVAKSEFCTKKCKYTVGSPFIMQDNNTGAYYLYGIFSYNKNAVHCNRKETFYIKVDYFNDWIKKTITWVTESDDNSCKTASCSNLPETTNNNMIPPQECGKMNRSFEVATEIRSSVEHWPWHASFINGTQPVCMGTLISNQWILTSGYCVVQIKLFKIKYAHLGDIEVYDDYDGMTPEDILIDKIITHPKYIVLQLHNNIALVRLKTPVTKSKSIYPLCLPPSKPPSSRDEKLILAYHPADTNTLHEQRVEITTTQDCVKYYKNDNIDMESEFCVKVCYSTIGNPLIGRDTQTDVYYLIGMYSYHNSNLKGCADRIIGFSNITYYEEWIRKTISK